MTRHAYKTVQLQQLQSFSRTVRLGSLVAAAKDLGVSQPTVCEQVHALERTLGVKLVERYRHGCRPTEAGHILDELAVPLLAGIGSLRQVLHERLGMAKTKLTIAATQRVLTEDLPDVILAFEREHPQVCLHLVEMPYERILPAVESGAADIGLCFDEGNNAAHSSLIFEPAYELEYVLLVPKNHPLAERRSVTPKDLVGYPLVNARNGIVNSVVAAELEKLGLFNIQPRKVDAVYAAVIRQYVRLGFGIGLSVSLPHRIGLDKSLHERSMNRHFQRDVMCVVHRQNALPQPVIRAFSATINATLGPKSPRRRVATRRPSSR